MAVANTLVIIIVPDKAERPIDAPTALNALRLKRHLRYVQPRPLSLR